MTQAERDTMLTNLVQELHALTIAVMGNGTKGLSERVDVLEKETRPTTAKILQKRAVDAAVIGVIIVGLEILLKLA